VPGAAGFGAAVVAGRGRFGLRRVATIDSRGDETVRCCKPRTRSLACSAQ
jgi:hypothetical protein